MFTLTSSARAPAPARRHARVTARRSRVVVARASPAASYDAIDDVLSKVRALPPSERAEALERATTDVRAALKTLKDSGAVKVWNSAGEAPMQRRNVFPNELKRLLKCAPEQIARPSDANDFNLIVTVTLSTSLLATVVGATLPGDCGAYWA